MEVLEETQQQVLVQPMALMALVPLQELLEPMALVLVQVVQEPRVVQEQLHRVPLSLIMSTVMLIS
jgi:hypothetical protein